jgi:photosynthetic reaction center cytochrome c subunit
MKVQTIIRRALGTAVLCGVAAVSLMAQANESLERAEQHFKNVQILKGISVQEFMETMGFFSASTNLNCTGCHGDESAGSWEKYADDPPMKQKARSMMLMVNAMNKTYFAGQRKLTCFTCHRNSEIPRVTPTLAEQYAVPLPVDPDEIAQQAPNAPSPDEVLNKYLQAVGGLQKLATFRSLVAKGGYQGYDDVDSTPVEMYAQASGQFLQLNHGPNGDRIIVDDGRAAWTAQPPEEGPVPVLALGGGDLQGLHLEAQLLFPGRIKQLLTNLRVGYPVSGTLSILPNTVGAGIDDRELTVVQGTTLSGAIKVRLSFDTESGLLVRVVRYTNLPFGFITTELDFADYRDVSGIKFPFRITKTWVDGRSVIELNSVEMNAAIDARKFTKPAIPRERTQ